MGAGPGSSLQKLTFMRQMKLERIHPHRYWDQHHLLLSQSQSGQNSAKLYKVTLAKGSQTLKGSFESPLKPMYKCLPGG